MKTDADSRRRRRRVALGLVTVLAALALVWTARRLAVVGPCVPTLPSSGGAEPPAPAPAVRAPAGTRIRVEVLNATPRQGLARRATFHLRDAGFDVVRTATSRLRSDSTVVIDRTGHPEWARLMARALGEGTRVETRPDSSGYVDLTVLLGAAYRPPAQPFYP